MGANGGAFSFATSRIFTDPSVPTCNTKYPKIQSCGQLHVDGERIASRVYPG